MRRPAVVMVVSLGLVALTAPLAAAKSLHDLECHVRGHQRDSGRVAGPRVTFDSDGDRSGEIRGI